jgi:membrane protease YdiL (CAAX protease family)
MTFRFFFYTIALSWLGFALAAAVPKFGSAIFTFAIFMPALVAIWLTGTTRGAAGLQALFARVFEWRVGLQWYVFAIGYMLAIRLAAAAIQRIATGTWPHFGHQSWLLIALAIAISIPVQAGEEIGWRGYALPRLGAKFGYGTGSAILGVLWALWHLPVFFMLPGNGNYGQSFPLFFVGVVPLSIAMGWLFVHTKGSVLLAMLMHAAVNNTHDIVQSGYAAVGPLSLNTTLVAWLTIALLWVGAVYFIIRMDGRPSQIFHSA